MSCSASIASSSLTAPAVHVARAGTQALVASLQAHLDWFAERGQQVLFWWRDDDAVAPSSALDSLTGLATSFDVPLLLAVIPHHATEALAGDVQSSSLIEIGQHGWQHFNHQQKELGEKASEFGARRTREQMAAEIIAGRITLLELFGEHFQRLFVPPWNRISPTAARILREQDYGLSTFTWIAPFHLPMVQCHLDIIKWKRGKRFIGWRAAQRRLDVQLLRRRANPSEPIGLLTHHLDHGEGCLEFLQVLFEVTCTHAGARWCKVSELLSKRQKELRSNIVLVAPSAFSSARF